MGGNSNSNRQPKKASPNTFAFLSFFKPSAKRSRKVEDSWDNSVKAYKVWPSDEDRGRWVAEPDIDRKASAYIARVHAVNVAAAADRQYE